MIDKLKNWSEHVADEAVTTAQLLNDAANTIIDARNELVSVTDAYRKTLRANGYEADTDSLRHASEFLRRRDLW